MAYKDKKKAREYIKQWEKENPIRVRASYLVKNYRAMDKRASRDKGDITVQWIIDNIFTKPCAHCGKTGWQVIGCNRIDNTKSHTMDNVEPCCEDCNHKLDGVYIKSKYGKQVDQIDMTTGEVLRTWATMREADRNGYARAAVKKCCDGEYLQAYGFMWKRQIIED